MLRPLAYKLKKTRELLSPFARGLSLTRKSVKRKSDLDLAQSKHKVNLNHFSSLH